MTSTTAVVNRLATLTEVLDGLMRRYQERVPDVAGIINAMIQHGVIAQESDIENDHIAFRTMGVNHLGLQSLEKIFLHYGYEKRDMYDFPAKKLTAYWYNPPRPEYPRIFISELRVHELSEEAQQIILSYTNEVQNDPVDELNLDNGADVDEFLHKPLWRLPTFEDYKRLMKESEYAAWVIYNRYYLNHFTITIHNLPEAYNTIAKFNDFVEANGFVLNDSGGKIKVSQDKLLIQSSTVAHMIAAEFDNGQGGTNTHQISGSYVEFAERRVLPEFANLDEAGRTARRDGFDSDNANNIFESTYSDQTKKR